MKIRLRNAYASPHGNFQAGAIADLPDEIANELLKANCAEIVEEPAIETTHLDNAEETTAIRTGKPKIGKKK